MTLEILQKEMVKAMKENDRVRKSVISSAIAAVKKAAIDSGNRDNITEELVDKVLLKEQKTIKEMIDTCPADRQDLLDSFNLQYNIISEYAPRLITDRSELTEVIKKIISEKVDDPSSFGTAMRVISPLLKGKANMKLVTEIVKELYN